jgi:crotonobetainyl-CoA:carnitine CoA-transferase CaiB-like acyl-CoA transferase
MTAPDAPENPVDPAPDAPATDAPATDGTAPDAPATGGTVPGDSATGAPTTAGEASAGTAPAGAGPGGPLAGIVVIDLTRALAGPHAAMMMGDLGARVIKVETPGTGDDTRGWGPPFVAPGQVPSTADADDRESTYFLSCNRNKESITLDLKSEDGREVLTRLIRKADVLLENFRPGVLDRLGFPGSELHRVNPRLVVLSISGFGHDGPEGGRAGYDQIAQGEGGLMSLTGPGPDQPQRVGVPIGDLLAGMYGAYGVLAALLERERTGHGQIVRTSLLAAIVGVHAFQGTRFTVAGQVGRAQGNHHPSITPYGLFRCRDGVVQLAVGSETQWQRFCAGFDLDPQAPGMATNGDRVTHRDQVTALLEATFADLDADTLLPRLAGLGIPAGRVRTLDEVYDWEQTLSQGLVVDVEHPTLGALRLPGPPLRFFHSGSPAAGEGADDRAGDGDRTENGDRSGNGEVEVTRTEHLPPPLLDEHATRIRTWLGL